jgi:hypothetical protein
MNVTNYSRIVINLSRCNYISSFFHSFMLFII